MELAGAWHQAHPHTASLRRPTVWMGRSMMTGSRGAASVGGRGLVTPRSQSGLGHASSQSGPGLGHGFCCLNGSVTGHLLDLVRNGCWAMWMLRPTVDLQLFWI